MRKDENYWSDPNQIEIRKKKYNCDGRCYWNTGMCPRADYCEETRFREGMATLFAILIIIGAYITFFAFVIIIIIEIIKMLFK